MRKIIVTLLLLAVPATSLACLWDYDTLEMERRRFPEILELITGKFLRHSKEFYEWRIGDRIKRIEQEPTNAALYDDLAVAYDKTGRQDKAIETMLKVEEFDPGRYETAANLGTFHIHAGQFEEGLTHIEKAIEINPDAHFGREEYQKLLVEYVLARREKGISGLPLNVEVYAVEDPIGFGVFVLQEKNLATVNEDGQAVVKDSDKADAELQKAIKGVCGMMRFGHYDSPVLLEAVADLLLSSSRGDAKNLAGRALLKASYEVKEEPARQRYREGARDAIEMQTPDGSGSTQLELTELEQRFRRELGEAEEWYSGLYQDELDWIAAGKDVDAEFKRKYYDGPSIKLSDLSTAPRSILSPQRIGLTVFGTAIGLIAIRIILRNRRPVPAQH